MSTLPDSVPPKLQFRLLDLFLLTTAVAAIAGIAVALGTHTLPWTIGLLFLTANAAGYLRPFQFTSRSRQIWQASAWLLFLIALVLPALKVFSVIHGWLAAWIGLQLEVELAYELIFLTEEDSRLSVLFMLLIYTAINLNNILVASSPVWIYFEPRAWSHWITTAVTISAPAVWLFTFQKRGEDMYSGAVVWYLATAVFVSSSRPSWKVWGIAVVAGILAILWSVIYGSEMHW